MHLVEPPASLERPGAEEGRWPLAVALAVLGPLALVLTVALIAIAVTG